MGAFWFGIVVGYITYRTLHHRKESAIADIASVIGAIGGAAVLALFPVEGGRFDSYAFGLVVGFFVYIVLSLVLSIEWIANSLDRSAGGRAFLGNSGGAQGSNLDPNASQNQRGG